MAQKIYIGNISKGLERFVLPFNIDNDAFPTLFNAYAWRGRVKKKRGTVSLGRLQRQMQIQTSSPIKLWQLTPFALVGGAGNLITQYSLTNGTIVPKSLSLIVSGDQTYTDPNSNGTLVGSASGTGTINYATGEFTVSGSVIGTVTGTFSYYPDLPVLGLRDFISTLGSQYPLLLAFDSDYSYQFNASTNNFYSTSYYKTTGNPVIWDGQNYQQFWTTNYQGALWETNNVPGFHFVNATYTSGSGSTMITFNFKSGGINYTNLVVGDQIWFNEWPSSSTINGLVGTVSSIAGAASGNYVITFTGIQTVSGTGIGQLLSNSIPGQDGIRWYDGDPTAGTGLPVGNNFGWVNFSPPLTATSTTIDDEPSAKYYLVGASSIVAFKDRLLFFSPWIQTSISGSAPVQLNDVALWSWNGTPYYTSLVPAGQTSDPTAYYVDQTGKGGWLSAGLDQFITTVVNNEDVLIVGFTNRQTRFVYTGNDLYPFLFYIINSELGSGSQFSGITLDRGALAFGVYGLTLTTQVTSQRIDLSIPDQVFQLSGAVGSTMTNALQRISSARDFYHEWVYFTFVPNSSRWVYPTQTLQYNYREQSWAIHYENFTAHGQYRRSTSYTWATSPFPNWATANETWNSATLTALFPNVVAGNPQGFVVIKGEGTGEAPTGYISALANASGFYQITSNDHCVAVGDYLYFMGCIGNTGLNMLIGRVQTVIDANNFTMDIPYVSGTYLGLGTFIRLIQPLIQTKQFPVYWDQGRQVRLGAQKYLMDYTDNGQVTLNIYLSQDPDTAWNGGPIVPSDETTNSSLEYSTVLYTCPESTNIGLTPANVNLQTPTASSQYQIWHRINTSLIGESVQIGITLNDAQMRNLTYATSDIVLQALQLDCYPGPILS